MDIKTRLEDDPILFMSVKSLTARGQMIKYLEERGIITIEDLINCSPTYFKGYRKAVYNAMIEVYKHEYLGEPLVTDVLFDKEYEHSDSGYQECSRDLERLGLKGVSERRSAIFYRIISFFEADEKCVKKGTGYYDPDVWKVFPSEKYNGKKFNIEQLLIDHAIESKGVNLSSYYLNYMEQKRKEQQVNIGIDDSATLSDLKKQFQSLLEMRDNLDAQIQSIQESIERIERGENENVRK